MLMSWGSKQGSLQAVHWEQDIRHQALLQEGRQHSLLAWISPCPMFSPAISLMFLIIKIGRKVLCLLTSALSQIRQRFLGLYLPYTTPGANPVLPSQSGSSLPGDHSSL
ncbi:hypothetical protein Y1Q_0020843 [Alligator mississippiensis]|uniref:Uncharacterized protein n=1 Tax=Alligator mississippiensis TaxID=8496 RepID=A0A151NJ23_ALLMI|nr:hypothetical protein Y1Q_0020843 [Alligator mississippiensis]